MKDKKKKGLHVKGGRYITSKEIKALLPTLKMLSDYDKNKPCSNQ